MEFIQTGITDGFQAGKFITLDCSADLNEAGERRGHEDEAIDRPSAGAKQSEILFDPANPWQLDNIAASVVLLGLRWVTFHRFNQSDLAGIDDFESVLLIVKNNGLSIGTHHQVIGMRHDEILLVTEHNSNRSKGLGIHQLFDLVDDHRAENKPLASKKQVSSAGRAVRPSGRQASTMRIGIRRRLNGSSTSTHFRA